MKRLVAILYCFLISVVYAQDQYAPDKAEPGL